MTSDRHRAARVAALATALLVLLVLAGSAGAETATPLGIPLAVPPPLVLTSAVLRGPQGCVDAGSVVSRVRTVNAVSVTFIRDGRHVGTRPVSSLGSATTAVTTRLATDDRRSHSMLVRVLFADGASPSGITLLHRFGRCSAGAAA